MLPTRALMRVFTVGALLAASLVALSSSTAPVGAQSCTEVLNVFARGSGQGLGAGEASRWYSQFQDRIGGVTSTNYELGTSRLGGAQYQPVGVGFTVDFWNSWDRIRNSMEGEASWTGSLGGQYRQSVRAGVTELTTYLNSQASTCSDQLIVLGGYSQGAHVIGDALPSLSRSIRDRIAFVGFFGDPKLYLPEGRGIPTWINNHACNGTKSLWRRGNVGCLTDGGSLDARRPYLPTDLESKTGSWCDREDFVCNNDISDINTPAHGQYKSVGGSIDEAAVEGARKLQARLPARSSEFNTELLVFGAGTAGVDLVFIIDSTGSMGSAINSAKALARQIGHTIVDEFRGRVALTEYRDDGDPFLAEIRTPLTRDIDAFERDLAAISVNGGGDTPEATLAALMTSLNGLDWTPGATKAAVVISDAGFHSPDRATGVTIAEVAARALEIDPVNVYPVVPASVAAQYQELADRTSGRVVINSGDTTAALTEALDLIKTRPVVLFSQEVYLSPIGALSSFDASRSYAVGGEIVKYEWDFDADGVFDLESDQPLATHTYHDPYDGLVELRVTDSNGNATNGVVFMTVSEDPVGGEAPPAPTLVGVTDGEDGSVRITWEYDSSAHPVDGFSIGEGADLAVIGASPDSRTIVIRDIPADVTELQLTAYNRWGWSEPTAVPLAQPNVDSTPPPTTLVPDAPSSTTSSVPAASSTQVPATTAADAGPTTEVLSDPGAAQGLALTGSELRLLGVIAFTLLAAGLVVLVSSRRRDSEAGT